MTDPTDNLSRNDNERAENDIYREIHEWVSSKSLSETVVTALADFKGVDVTEIEPLYENIDPDALEALFAPNGNGFRHNGQISFSFNDKYVTIHSHGEFAVISIREKPPESGV